MATIKMRVYNGINYETIEIEEVTDESGNPTGYYKQISKESSSIFGILDEKEKYDEVCRTIDEMTTVFPQQYFYALIGSDGYIKIFTTLGLYAIPNSVESISKGVLDEIAAVGYVTEVNYANNEIQFLISEKETGNQLSFVFKSFLDHIIKED